MKAFTEKQGLNVLEAAANYTGTYNLDFLKDSFAPANSVCNATDSLSVKKGGRGFRRGYRGGYGGWGWGRGRHRTVINVPRVFKCQMCAVPDKFKLGQGGNAVTQFCLTRNESHCKAMNITVGVCQTDAAKVSGVAASLLLVSAYFSVS